MRGDKIWARLLGVERAVVERIVGDCDGAVVVHVRPYAREAGRCCHCRRPCGGYDQGGGRRRWRAPDLGLVQVYVEADAPRVRCAEHGVVVAHVPWARPSSRATRAFEDTVAWLVARTDKTTVSTLMRIAWRSVGGVVERVTAEAIRRRDPLDGVRRIGIDDVSYRRGHRYLTVVVDHDSGRLLWASPGRDEKNLERFFDALGPQRCALIELVSADASRAYRNVVAARCPNATMCMDPFHVVKWATDAVDKVRRQVWNDVREDAVRTKAATTIKQTRYALLKNPEDLNPQQRTALSAVEKLNKPLFRGYLLKEHLREVFRVRGERGRRLLDGWLRWARRCRLEPFKKVARAIADNYDGIVASLIHGLTNARVEALNTRMQLLTRVAFGFHGHKPLIALAMLKLGGFCPPLPGRSGP